MANFVASMDSVKKIRDANKAASRTISSFSKDTVVSYLQNVSSNEQNLRNLSWYLLYRSQIFQRIIMYYSTLFAMECRTVIPQYSLTQKNNDTKILKSYSDTLKILDNWNIEEETLKVRINCFIQDVSYNIAYHDENGLYLLPWPANYGRIVGQYADGSFMEALDMTYFRGTNEWLLEEWGSPFTEMYADYQSGGNSSRWQIVPEEYSACFKWRSNDPLTILSPFSGLFLSLINLEDVTDNQAVADAQEIYKLIYAPLETMSNSTSLNAWKVNPDLVRQYMDAMVAAGIFPDYSSVGIAPSELKVIDFSSNDKASETNKVLKATESVLNTSGGAQILNSATVSGTTAFNAAIKNETEFAISSLLPQFEGWLNRMLNYEISNPSYVKFAHVGRLTKDDYQDRLLSYGQNGLPTKLAIMSMSGFSELQTLALNHMEDILDLSEKFSKPLKTSYTQSSTEAGAPTKSDTEISDDGEASREKADRANG